MNQIVGFSFLTLLVAACTNVPRQPSRAPASALDGDACGRTAGATPEESHVVATHVVPMAGVSVVAEGDRIGLRFATTENPGAALALDPVTLRVLGSEAPQVETPSSGAPARQHIELPDHRRLVAWTEGSLENGYRVRATVLSLDGSAAAPTDLGDQGSAVGQPVVAVTPAGDGVVAFIESNDHGFRLVVKRVCVAAPGIDVPAEPAAVAR
jgi:hypothetical protein